MSLFKRFSFFVAILLGFVFSGCQSFKKQDCVENRLAFDFGSGTLKAKAAEINVCKGLVLKSLYETQVKSNFKEDIKSSGPAKLISELSVDNSISFVRKVLEETRSFSISKTIAVGTAALREAKNSADLVAKVKQVTGVEVVVIDQDEEARLGYLSVLSLEKYHGKNLLVWDIGGGSQQLIWGDYQRPMIIKSDLASITFKDRVIEQIKKQDPRKNKSPNPLSNEQILKAKQLAMQEGEKIISNTPIPDGELIVVGIGGVLSISVPNQIKTKNFDHNQISLEIKNRTGWADKKIGGDYPETDLTNLILVSSLMEIFGIKKYNSEKLNLTDGLLFK